MCILLYFCTRTRRLTEAGIIEKLMRDSVAKSAFCLDPGKQDTELLPLQLQDVYGILAVFGGGEAYKGQFT